MASKGAKKTTRKKPAKKKPAKRVAKKKPRKKTAKKVARKKPAARKKVAKKKTAKRKTAKKKTTKKAAKKTARKSPKKKTAKKKAKPKSTASSIEAKLNRRISQLNRQLKEVRSYVDNELRDQVAGHVAEARAYADKELTRQRRNFDDLLRTAKREQEELKDKLSDFVQEHDSLKGITSNISETARELEERVKKAIAKFNDSDDSDDHRGRS